MIIADVSLLLRTSAANVTTIAAVILRFFGTQPHHGALEACWIAGCCCFFSLINHSAGFSSKKHLVVASRVNSLAARSSEDTVYLVPAHPVTLPLHPPHIFRIPQLMYLKRQRDSVPRETAFSRSDSALSVVETQCHGTPRFLSEAKTCNFSILSPVCSWLVLSDGWVSWAN